MGEATRAELGMSSAEIDTMRAVEDELWWYQALRGHVLEAIEAVSRCGRPAVSGRAALDSRASGQHSAVATAPPPAGFDLLDAGCGSGGMLARVRTRFPKASLTGLDFSERALELTRLRATGATLVQGSVDALPFRDASFDVILSLDVLIVGGLDQRAVVTEMHRVLRPGGALILNLPAFDFLRGSHDVAVNIARRYTRPRAERLLSDAGFALERWTYWNMTLLPAVAVVRWLSRRRVNQRVVPSDLKPIWPPLNAALKALVSLELSASRLFSLPFGTSLFAVARK